MRKEIEKIINNIKPALHADGGDIELVSVSRDGVVKVRLRGACAHCPMSQITLKNFIEKHLKKEVKGVKKVISV